MPRSGIYKITNTQTGETYTGTVSECSVVIGCPWRTFSTAWSKPSFTNGLWKCEKVGHVPSHKVLKETEAFTKRMQERLKEPSSRNTVKALWDAYTSGRSDMWTLTEIASEFNVTVNDIIKVLEEEGVKNVL